MKITRTSIISGNISSMEINITEEQLQNWQHGMLIQNAAPNLTADEREFIISGITPEEWEKTFGKGENA